MAVRSAICWHYVRLFVIALSLGAKVNPTQSFYAGNGASSSTEIKIKDSTIQRITAEISETADKGITAGLDEKSLRDNAIDGKGVLLGAKKDVQVRACRRTVQKQGDQHSPPLDTR